MIDSMFIPWHFRLSTKFLRMNSMSFSRRKKNMKKMIKSKYVWMYAECGPAKDVRVSSTELESITQVFSASSLLVFTLLRFYSDRNIKVKVFPLSTKS